MRDASAYYQNRSNRGPEAVALEGKILPEATTTAVKAPEPVIGRDAWKTKELKDDAVIDALDTQCVSNELIEDWTMREAKAFAPALAAGIVHEDAPPGLPPHVRMAALTYMMCDAQRLGLQHTSWFEAATLLDTYHLKTMDPTDPLHSIESLPATCAALVSILKKNDCQATLVGPAGFVPVACRFAECMKGMGCDTVNVEVSAKMIETRERHVLQVLGWRIKVPTTESWCTTFVARYNIITQNLLAPKLHWVWQRCLFNARLIIMQRQLSTERPPKVLAVGLLGLGLLAARLLPLKALQPPQIASEEWEDLYKLIHAQDPHPQCEIPEKHVSNMLEVLTVAVGADLEVIQKCCHVTSLAMQDAMRDAPESLVARDSRGLPARGAPLHAPIAGKQQPC